MNNILNLNDKKAMYIGVKVQDPKTKAILTDVIDVARWDKEQGYPIKNAYEKQQEIKISDLYIDMNGPTMTELDANIARLESIKAKLSLKGNK